jgi:hypothetical protein
MGLTMHGGLGRAVVQFAALMLVGLVAGATFGIWQGYDPTGLSAAAFIEMHQNAVRGLNVLLPALALTGAVLVTILALFSRKRRSILGLYVAALSFILAGGAVTRSINQPINAEVMTWTTETLPQTWTALRDRWWSWHVVRTLLAMTAQTLLIGAVLLDCQVKAGVPAPPAED